VRCGFLLLFRPGDLIFFIRLQLAFLDWKRFRIEGALDAVSCVLFWVDLRGGGSGDAVPLYEWEALVLGCFWGCGGIGGEGVMGGLKEGGDLTE